MSQLQRIAILRLREGDRFIAMDGKGKWWLAQLQGEKAQILESLTVETELPLSITLMVALPKGNGFDDVVKVCTELGVAVIAPVGKRSLSHFTSSQSPKTRTLSSKSFNR